MNAHTPAHDAPLLALLRAALKRGCGLALWCCLLVAVPLYGLSGVLIGLRGRQHSHTTAPAADAPQRSAGSMAALTPGADKDPMAGWVDFRRVVAKHVPAAHDHDQSHDHAGLARHHHDQADTSVVALDGGHADGSADDAGPAGFTHVLATTALSDMALPRPATLPWPSTAPSAVAPWLADTMDRPPRA